MSLCVDRSLSLPLSWPACRERLPKFPSVGRSVWSRDRKVDRREKVTGLAACDMASHMMVFPFSPVLLLFLLFSFSFLACVRLLYLLVGFGFWFRFVCIISSYHIMSHHYHHRAYRIYFTR